MDADIHAFSLAYLALGFKMDLHRAANSPSYIIGVVGRREGALAPPEVLGVFPWGGGLRRHPRTT